MSRNYYGHYYNGQFRGLDCSTISHARGEEDVILAAEADYQERWNAYKASCGIAERQARKVFEALSDSLISLHGQDKIDQIRRMVYWAKRLEYCRERGL